jgi:hypothetical protein
VFSFLPVFSRSRAPPSPSPSRSLLSLDPHRLETSLLWGNPHPQRCWGSSLLPWRTRCPRHAGAVSAAAVAIDHGRRGGQRAEDVVNRAGRRAKEEVVVLGVARHRLLCVREEGLRRCHRQGKFFYGRSIRNQPLEIRVFTRQQSGGSHHSLPSFYGCGPTALDVFYSAYHHKKMSK